MLKEIDTKSYEKEQVLKSITFYKNLQDLEKQEHYKKGYELILKYGIDISVFCYVHSNIRKYLNDKPYEDMLEIHRFIQFCN